MTASNALAPAPLERYLGPARVVRLSSDGVVVALEGEAEQTVVRATMALTFPYRPTVGDQLLVIGDARAFWVIGVLRGRGQIGLADASGVVAESGRLRLTGDRGVRLSGTRIEAHAQRLERVALTAFQILGDARTRVRERWRVEAGEVDELSRKHWLMRARRVVMKSLEKTRVKSHRVRLG